MQVPSLGQDDPLEEGMATHCSIPAWRILLTEEPGGLQSIALLLLLLLLSGFSRVRLCVTPETAAPQAPLSLGFSRQEHWSGLPFPSPMHESENWKWSRSVCLTLSDPIDCSPPGSPIHEIFQARVLEWGAIAFSKSIVLQGVKHYWSNWTHTHTYVYMCIFYSGMKNNSVGLSWWSSI